MRLPAYGLYPLEALCGALVVFVCGVVVGEMLSLLTQVELSVELARKFAEVCR